MNLWQFSKINNIEESAFNKILERFSRFGIMGLVRENIQNSLDGRIKECIKPVKITIETGEMDKANIPAIEEVAQRIHALKGRNEYSKETIAHMQSTIIKEEKVSYLTFEDENTRGLTGAEFGQTDNDEHTWSVYAYNKGVHASDADEVFENSRGGSHGVGKIASNAASDTHMMYFANCDADGNQHIGGTVELIEHQYEGQAYRSTGYFSHIQELIPTGTKYMAIPNTYQSIFKKETRGLKIIIPYLKEEFNNENAIITSVIDNFFVAILQGKLEVIVNGQMITASTLQNFIQNPQYYVQDRQDMKKIFTPLYINSYLAMDKEEIEINIDGQPYHFDLYFQYDEMIPNGRVGIIRTIGMKIEDRGIPSYKRKPYNAVLLAHPNADGYMKSLENESHTKLSNENIYDKKLKSKAGKFLRELEKAVISKIDEVEKEKIITDGAIDTSEIIYLMNHAFENTIKKDTETVEIKPGKKMVKLDPAKKKAKKGAKGSEKPKKLRKITPRKGNQRNNRDGEHIRYATPVDLVERVQMSTDEIVVFHLKGQEEIKNEQVCSIELVIIDGNERELKTEVNLKQQYSTIIDRQTGKTIDYTKDKLVDVPIHEGMIDLQLQLTPSANTHLKYKYYIEVDKG